jgi:hypothetical protein
MQRQQQQHAVTQAALLVTNLGPGDPCTGDRWPRVPARAKSEDPAVREQKHSNAACHYHVLTTWHMQQQASATCSMALLAALQANEHNHTEDCKRP